jgi:hypothetical protein
VHKIAWRGRGEFTKCVERVWRSGRVYKLRGECVEGVESILECLERACGRGECTECVEGEETAQTADSRNGSGRYTNPESGVNVGSLL